MATQPKYKVLMINGSPRPNGNTFHELEMLKETFESEGIEAEICQLGGKDTKMCKACYSCKKTGKCFQEDPLFDEICAKMIEADGIIIGSPTYYADVSAETKAFMDRCGFVYGSRGKLARKFGAAVVTARRGGAIHVFDSINHFYLMNNVIVVGSSYWNDGYDPQCTKDEVLQDEECKRTMKNLALNMSWLIKSTKH